MIVLLIYLYALSNMLSCGSYVNGVVSTLSESVSAQEDCMAIRSVPSERVKKSTVSTSQIFS